MKIAAKIIFFISVFALYLPGGFAQDAAKTVKWQGIAAKDNELVYFMPEGFITAIENDYYLGRPNVGAHVVKKVVLGRYINGVALISEFYEGDAGEIQNALEDRGKLVFGPETEIGRFKVKKFTENTGGKYTEGQHFLVKNRLYVLKTISMSG